MQTIKAWLCENPPYRTGYWCSIARGLAGALLLAKIREANVPAIYLNDLSHFLPLALSYVLAVCLVAGLFSRPAVFIASALCLISYYIYSLQLPNPLHLPLVTPGSFGDPTNLYFLGVVLFFLGFTPCGDYYSLDARWSKRTPQAAQLWGVQLILYQVCAMYLWTAISKLNSVFMSGYSLELAWIYGAVGSLGYFHQPEATRFFQVFGFGLIVMELALAVLLFVPRWRKAGLAVGVVFHVGATMLLPVWGFTAAVLISYLLFLDPPEHYGGIRPAEAEAGL